MPSSYASRQSERWNRPGSSPLPVVHSSMCCTSCTGAPRTTPSCLGCGCTTHSISLRVSFPVHMSCPCFLLVAFVCGCQLHDFHATFFLHYEKFGGVCFAFFLHILISQFLQFIAKIEKSKYAACGLFLLNLHIHFFLSDQFCYSFVA